jgi:release factor glutamine methyltransferase
MMETTASESVGTGLTVRRLLCRARSVLAGAGIETAALEATWLLEKVLQTSQSKLLLHQDRVLTRSEWADAELLVSRRAAREPLQYILGSQEFCGLEFDVNRAVLIPRPETELLVEEAKQVLAGRESPRVADIGTGSGCLAVSLASVVPDAVVYAVDCSSAALAVAQKNIVRHSVQNKVTPVLGDLCSPLGPMGLVGRIDVIVSNPPYISETEWDDLQPEVRDFEPRGALLAGTTGTEVHRRLLEQSWRYLSFGGWLFMEAGMGQSETICRLVRETGRYARPAVRRDAAGIGRVIRAQSLS